MTQAEPRTAAILSASVLVGYSAVALAVGSLYPFSVFPMYATQAHETRAARLAARTATGEAIEVTSFSALDCDRSVDPDTYDELCGAELRAFSPRYIDDALAQHVREHAAEVEHGEPIEIVRRVWSLDEHGIYVSSDCVLARCAATR